MPSPTIVRERAVRDVEDIVDHYIAQGSIQAAERFVNELEGAYRQIADFPSSGSARFASALALPGLRAWHLSIFPYFVFYVVADKHIDIWRVLHDRRDIPQSLQGKA
jgi:toxin ParE1/3/4